MPIIGCLLFTHVEWLIFAYFSEWREWSDDLPGGEKRTIMTVRGLEPATDYSITLYAVNAVGEGTPIELPYTTKARSKWPICYDLSNNG